MKRYIHASISEDWQTRRDIAVKTFDSNLLAKLANDPSVPVRKSVVNNRNTPQDVIDQLAEDIDSSVRADVAYRTNDPALLAKLADDESALVRQLVAARTNDPQLIAKFATDPDGWVRDEIVSKIKDPAVLVQFVNDPSDTVRYRLASTANSRDILDKLRHDSDNDVRSKAESRLRQLGFELEPRNERRKENAFRWTSIINKLYSDLDYGDPFYEQTEAAQYIESIQQDVEEKLGIWLEPSIQAGIGGIWIYSRSDDSVLAKNIDYQSFNDSVADLAINSGSKSVFKKKYKDYLKDLITK